MAWKRAATVFLFLRAHLDTSAPDPSSAVRDATSLDVPDGAKLATEGWTDERYPVVLMGDFTFWPLSYIDNRVSFDIVVTDFENNTVNSFEAPGARYISDIDIDTVEKTVVFYGQNDDTAVLRWEVLAAETTLSSGSSPTPTTSSSSGSSSTSPSSTFPSSPPSSHTSSSNVGPIAGGVVGGVVGGVAVIIAVILYLIWIRPAWRKRQQRRKDVERTAANPGTTANPSTAHPNGEKLYNASIRSDPTFIQDGQTVVSEPVGVSKWLGELPPATPETGEGELGESPSSQRPASISALTGTTAMH